MADPSVAAGVKLLTIGRPTYPKPLTFDPLFSEITLNARTYTLPFTFQLLTDDGWELDQNSDLNASGGFDTVLKPYASTSLSLVRPDNVRGMLGAVYVTAVNPSAESTTVGRSQVWGISLNYESDQQPYSGIYTGASADEVNKALGASVYLGTTGLAFREFLSARESGDLTGTLNRTDARISWAQVYVDMHDGAATGQYRLQYTPVEDMTNGYISMPYGDWSKQDDSCWRRDYGWLIPSDLSPASFVVDGTPVLTDIDQWPRYTDLATGSSRDFVSGAAMYSIDNHRYAMSATGDPECEKMADVSVNQKDGYLFSGMRYAKPIDGTPEKRLLWNRDDSSAAALIYHGPGASGDDVTQVVVNYCDWKHHVHLTYLYALISLDKNVKISDGAKNLLLTVASDATNSIIWTGR